MNNKTRNILSVIFLILIIAFFSYYISQHYSDFSSLTLVNPLYLLVLAFFFIINYYLSSVVTIGLLSPLGVRLSYIESFFISIVTGFYNLITPFRGGMAARAIYLKKKYNFSYTNFLSTISASYILIYLVASFLGMLTIFLIYLYEGIFSSILFFIFLAIFLPLLFIVIFSPHFPETRSKFINKFIKIANGWHLIKNNKRVIILILCLSLTQIIISSLSTYFQFSIFGINISITKAIFLSTVGSLSLVFAITPAGIGVNEAIMVFSALTINISPTQSLSAALLGRAIQMLVLFTLGPLFSYFLLRKKKQDSIKH